MGIFSRTTKKWVKRLRLHADQRRDVGDWLPAARAYRQLSVLRPRRADFLVQAGNCFKEAGHYSQAVKAYTAAWDRARDPEALFQMADALRRSGSTERAYATMQKATAAGSGDAAMWLESPEWFEKGLYSASMELFGPNGREVVWGARSRLDANNVRGRAWRKSLDRASHPNYRATSGKPVEGISVHQLGNIPVYVRGRQEHGATGVVAVRFAVRSREPLKGLRLYTQDRELYASVPEPIATDSLCHYEVNHWFDSGQLGVGVHQIFIEANTERGRSYSASHLLYVVGDMPPHAGRASDAYVPSFDLAPADLEAAVLDRPANHRRSLATALPEQVRTIYCQRLDQLGDLSASLDGMRDLRGLFPQATIICAVASRFKGIVESSGLVDEVIGCDLEYDFDNEMRFVADAEVDRLYAVLERYKFDLGIDLCPGDETRPILRLSNASYFVGFSPDRHDFLDFGIDVVTRDKINGKSNLAHRRHVKMLLSSLAIAMDQSYAPVRRTDDAVAGTPEPYAVIHAGARHAFNRWSIDKFCYVARLLVERAGIRVVLFADDVDVAAVEKAGLPAGATLAKPMSGDEFDRTVSGASLFIGNDSGPKHLAAARGVPTVSVHVNRLNWSEWGQDGIGYIVSKSVPCSGCGLNNIALCTKSVACLNSISADDVWESVSKLLSEQNIIGKI